MKRVLTSAFVLAGLLAAVSAYAIDLHPHGVQASPQSGKPATTVNDVLGCDDGVTWNGWYQGTDDRLGNLFDFGAGGVLSTVSFTHFDYSTAGPYDYNVEIWDPASCTRVAGRNGLVAASSVWTNTLETVDMCDNGIFVSGSLIVAIDPNTCNSPTDCYPDLVFDDQLGVFCPVIINNASTAPACYDVSAYGGPFLLRASVDECVTPTHTPSWGQLKSMYR